MSYHTIDDNLKKIHEHTWSEESPGMVTNCRHDKLIEEMTECIEAIAEYERNPTWENKVHMLEEIADVANVSRGFVLTDEVIRMFGLVKVNRTIKEVGCE
jgi:translation elongation factor EF-Tu-like GTPase